MGHPALVDLEEILFPGDSPWPAEMFWSRTAEPATTTWCTATTPAPSTATRASAVAGDEAEVHTIGVRPAAQGGGIGRRCCGELISAAGGRRMLLEVRTDNEPAIALYESEGFSRLGIRRRYYQPSGADAYTMARPG